VVLATQEEEEEEATKPSSHFINTPLLINEINRTAD